MPILTTLGAACAKAWGFTSGLVKDQYFNLVTLLLPGNGTNGAQNNTFLDSSTNNFTITRNGNTTQGTFSPFSQTGWGNYFNGSSNLQLSSNADFQPGTGNFTIEAWVNFSASNSMIVAVYNQGCAFYVKSTGFLAFAQDSVAERLVASTAFPLNQWNHVAVVRSSTTLTIYQNGVSVGSVSNSDNLTGTTVTVGSGNALSQGSTGYISNFRFVKNQALFTGAFTPAIAPINSTAVGSTGAGVPTQTITGTVALLTCQSNRFVDNSPTPKTITTGGSPSVVAFSPFAPTAAYTTAAVGGSGYFDGTGDYLNGPSNAAFAFGTGDFTIEAWVYTTSLAATRGIFDTRSTGNESTGVAFYIDTSGILTLRNNANIATAASALVVNSWNHVAVTRSGTTVKIYRNGDDVTSGTPTNSTNFTQQNSYIGSAYAAGFDQMLGYISGFRVLKGTALYTGSTYTVPTAPLTAITNTSLLLNFTNAGITDATAKNDLETVGNAQISTSVSKFGGGSIAFDGNGDGLYRPNTDLFNFGTGNFTIEFWLYYSSKTGYQTIASLGYSPGASTGWLIQTGNGDGKVIFYVQTSGTVIASDTGSTVNTGQWYHIAIVRNSGTTTIYRDGTSVGSGSDSTNYSTTGVFYIGGGTNTGFNGGYFNGYIDDFRITKGYARYTGNFTPPTAPFPVQ